MTLIRFTFKVAFVPLLRGEQKIKKNAKIASFISYICLSSFLYLAFTDKFSAHNKDHNDCNFEINY